MKTQIAATCLVLGMIGAASVAEPKAESAPAAAARIPEIKDIKAYCLDFNWGGRRSFARPGSWCNSDPAQHVAWYKTMGVNVIQTFRGRVSDEPPFVEHDDTIAYLPGRSHVVGDHQRRGSQGVL